jgi:two-component system sensor histidine kinase ChiS
VLLFSSICACNAGSGGKNAAPVARWGVIDLTAWDFQKDGSVDLNGEWEFYWRRLLTPQELSGSGRLPVNGFFTIPGIWNGRVIGGRKLNGDGYATFHLRVKMRPNVPPLAIRVLDETSAYQLWINGKKTAANGTVGTSYATTKPRYLLQISRVPPGGEYLDIVLQTANFNHSKGGVWNPITLGSETELSKKQGLRWGLDIFLFGCLLIMGVYHVCLFLIRRKDHSVLYFGLFSLVVACRTALTENRFFTWLFPEFSWELVFKAELLTVHAAFLLLLLFIRSLYPDDCSRGLMRVLQGICLAFGLVALVTYARISSLLVVPFHPVIIFIQGYIFYVLIKAILRNRGGGVTILSGLLIFFLTVVNDILHNYGIIATAYVAPFGFLFLVGSQSLALARRFSQAFSTVEQLSAERQGHIQELSRMDRLKDEFLANTSHELRTPLNGIIGLADSLGAGAAGPLSEQAKSLLEMISGSGRRLNNLVNDILDLSRLKNRDIQLHRKAVDLRALADTVMAVTGPLVRGKPLTLINAVPADLPQVDGDEDRLQQVLFNLVGNAVKFTDRGEVFVSATPGNPEIEVSVRDTGIGIPPDRLETIFNAFEQVDGSAARNHGGVGLGLGISRHLVELHGGRLWAESIPGSGSVFRFTLPVFSQAASSGAVEVRDHSPLPIPDLRTSILKPRSSIPDPRSSIPDPQPSNLVSDPDAPRILAVDDDPVNLQVVRSHLELEGMKVTAAAGGREALALIEGGEVFDLVLLDVMMPGMTGFQVCRGLRRRYNAAQLPVIMLTAKNRLGDLTKGLDSGANDYLGKPFAREELLARVRAQLKVRKAHELAQENSRLQREVELRARTELELRLTQRRLAGMLHAVPKIIIAVNENREIAFCNHAFEERFGYGAFDLLGQSVSRLFTAAAVGKLEEWLAAVGEGRGHLPTTGAPLELIAADGRPWSGRVVPASLELENERLLVLLLCGARGAAPSVLWIDDLSQNRQRLQQLEETLNGLTPLVLERHPGFIDDLRAVDRSLERMGMELAPELPEQEQRRLIVETMKLALDVWAEATQTTKADLARRTGQWAVYVNQDGWERTQTLDRYLSIDTLPAKPRLKKVLSTADFVLESCPAHTPLRRRFETALEHLRALD